MNIFAFAMEKEKYSESYYRDLAGRTGNEGLKNILNMLADEEAKHYNVVKNMQSGVPRDVAETTVLSDAKDIFTKMRESAEKFNFDISQKELYQKALQIEKDSRQFYLEKARELAEPRQKEAFKKLAEEENKHYVLLENIIDFVSRPEMWLENAEFFHLEEY